MLFFAVFCGSLAEYRLEHTIERERESEYMRSLVDDLASDTFELKQSIAFLKVINDGIDSLSQVLYNTNDVKKNTQLIYRLNGVYMRRFGVNFRKETSTQLKNSGTMRLIRNHALSNQIATYWSRTDNLEKMEESIMQNFDDAAALADEVINRNYYLSYSMRDTANQLVSVSINENAVLMTEDKTKLITYANKLFRVKMRITRFYSNKIQHHQQEAVHLILLIKDEYHFE